MILDFSIRHATSNRKSLDDVMRFLYHQYYKNLNVDSPMRNFKSPAKRLQVFLSREFEYINTTRDIDYSTYLSFAGLKLTEVSDGKTGKRKFRLTRAENMSSPQKVLFSSWCGQ
jgi:predicted metalloprotease with PDZ domain